jgi:hypothetical protein
MYCVMSASVMGAQVMGIGVMGTGVMGAGRDSKVPCVMATCTV